MLRTNEVDLELEVVKRWHNRPITICRTIGNVDERHDIDRQFERIPTIRKKIGVSASRQQRF